MPEATTTNADVLLKTVARDAHYALIENLRIPDDPRTNQAVRAALTAVLSTVAAAAHAGDLGQLERIGANADAARLWLHVKEFCSNDWNGVMDVHCFQLPTDPALSARHRSTSEAFEAHVRQAADQLLTEQVHDH